MAPDDPRHGTEAGHGQHRRDGEQACPACRDAKLRAVRRRTKLKTMGRPVRVPLGNDLYEHLIQLRNRGASDRTVGQWAGLSQTLMSRIYRTGPDVIVSVRTVRALNAMQVQFPVTPVGATRRVQALAYLGRSARAVAREAGLTKKTVYELRLAPGVRIAPAIAERIAEVYDRLSMEIPVARTPQEASGIARSRNLARRNGWLPPLAWHDIDDPNETPTCWEYRPASFDDNIAELIDRGAGISEACRVLHMSREAIEKRLERRGMRAEYRTLTGRETRRANGAAEEVA